MSAFRERLEREWQDVELAQQAGRIAFIEGRIAQDGAHELGVNRIEYFRLLKVARTQGILVIDPQPAGLMEPDRNTSLERRLVEEFSPQGLEHATILEVPPQLSGVDYYDRARDNYLHSLLGQAGAQDLRPLLNLATRIGLGGGRALLTLATNLKPIPGRNFDITSLAGGIFWKASDCDSIPADAVAFQAAKNLGEVELKLVERIPLSSESYIPDTEPQIAVFGIGNLSEPFRHFLLSSIFRHVNKPERINTLLEEVRNFLRENQGTEISEVLNQFQVVRPVNDDPINNVIEELNEFAQAYPLTGLREKVPVRIGIAGGVHKTSQIWRAVTSGTVNHLVTDALTAEALLRANVKR